MRNLRNIFVILILLVLVSCAKTSMKGSPGWVGYKETGKASYYAMKYDQDKLEISGINMDLKYFEDIADGERLYCEPVLMMRESIIEFAKKYDPQPFHIDEMSANKSIFNGLGFLSSYPFCLYSCCGRGTR